MEFIWFHLIWDLVNYGIINKPGLKGCLSVINVWVFFSLSSSLPLPPSYIFIAGVVKTHDLLFQECELLQAIFDKTKYAHLLRASPRWDHDVTEKF